MRGREEPPLSEGGSHWRVAEKGMRSTTLEVSGIVGGTADICVEVLQAGFNQHPYALYAATHCTQ